MEPSAGQFPQFHSRDSNNPGAIYEGDGRTSAADNKFGQTEVRNPMMKNTGGRMVFGEGKGARGEMLAPKKYSKEEYQSALDSSIGPIQKAEDRAQYNPINTNQDSVKEARKGYAAAREHLKGTDELDIDHGMMHNTLRDMHRGLGGAVLPDWRKGE
jgi:hypothetical protein